MSLPNPIPVPTKHSKLLGTEKKFYHETTRHCIERVSKDICPELLHYIRNTASLEARLLKYSAPFTHNNFFPRFRMLNITLL